MHSKFCPIYLIYVIRWNSLYFEKKIDSVLSRKSQSMSEEKVRVNKLLPYQNNYTNTPLDTMNKKICSLSLQPHYFKSFYSSNTRMHSSRMRTTRSLTVSPYLIVSNAQPPRATMHTPQKDYNSCSIKWTKFAMTKVFHKLPAIQDCEY